jgi:hypothetical protein
MFFYGFYIVFYIQRCLVNQAGFNIILNISNLVAYPFMPLRLRVLDFLCVEVGFDPALAQRMRQWRHSGFSVHNQIRVKAHDAEGRKQLARYMIRNPFALEKMTYDKQTGMVIYRSKFHASLKRNYQLLPATQWLKLLLAHIPDKYEHLVRYYGWYSNRARGERNPETSTIDGTTTLHIDETPADRKSKANWARLIQKVSALTPASPYLVHPWTRMRLTHYNAQNVITPCASLLSLTSPPLSAGYSNTCTGGAPYQKSPTTLPATRHGPKARLSP